MGNIIIRVDDKKKAAYEAAAKTAGLSLSEWLRSFADAAAELDTKATDVPTSKRADLAAMKPFDPEGPAVTAVPVKVRKSKKAAGPAVIEIEAAGPAVIEIEAATVAVPKTAPAPSAPPAVDRDYTGETSMFNSTLMYEYRLPNGRKSWTKEPPPGREV